MYFQSYLNKMLHYLTEKTIKDIIDGAKCHDGAILCYNKDADTIDVVNLEDRNIFGIGKLQGIVPIALFTKEDFEFANTNREIINTMSNETLGAFFVDRVLNDKGSICKYLGEQSEISTYNLAKIIKTQIVNNRLYVYTSNIDSGKINVGDGIMIAPIEENRYRAVVVEVINAVEDSIDDISNKVKLALEFEDSSNIPISVIPKLIGLGIKLAPKKLVANVDCVIESPAVRGANAATHTLGEGMIERRRKGGQI